MPSLLNPMFRQISAAFENPKPAALLTAVETIRDKTRGKSLVILYPTISFKNLFLAHFLENAKDGEGLLYFRVSNQVTLADLVTGIVEEFESVVGSFGKATAKTLKSEDAHDPLALAKSLAKDLNTYASQHKTPATLYLDELDRLPAIEHQISRFMEELVNQLSSNVQIVISSRLLSRQPYSKLVKDGKAVVLGSENRRDDIIFTVEDEPRPQLEVIAFGRGHALVDGKPITNWDGALPRNLFFYFIDRPLITRADIFETFWPSLPTKEATNVFHVTKRKISERISSRVGDGQNYELTQYVSGYYLPSEKLMRHYDIADFMDSIQEAEGTTDNERQQLYYYMRAIDLYRAPFLQTIDMGWIVQRRMQLQEQYANALIAVGRIYQGQGAKEEALGYFTRALKEAPNREDVHTNVMQLYMQLGLTDDARRQFQRMEEELQKVGLSPSAETRKMFKKLQNA